MGKRKKTMDYQNKVHKSRCMRGILIAQKKIPREQDKNPAVYALQRTGQFLEWAFMSLPGVVRGGLLLVTHLMRFQAQAVFTAVPSLNSNEHALPLWRYTVLNPWELGSCGLA